MRFAIIDNKRVEARPGQWGLCPCCSQPVVAKCGKQKVWHWAHRVNTVCDSWWETETEWHRAWKNNYPADWQEVSFKDERKDEKHIVDVFTNQGLVIEFQHSHIDQEERISREEFHKNMVWVVDGTRLKRDFIRFSKGISSNLIKNNKQNKIIRQSYIVNFPDQIFPNNWLKSSVPVIFDFNGLDISNNLALWCLLPQRVGEYIICFPISRELFINITLKYSRFFFNET